MFGRSQGVLAGNIEFVKINVMQKHIDTAKVVCGYIYLLPVKALLNFIVSEHLFRLKQQRARTAGGIVHLINLCLSNSTQPCQKLGNVGRREKLTARFSRI